MGHGSYTAADWSKLKASRKIEKQTSENVIFSQKSADPRFDPKYIHVREARDSDDHPHSTPVIIGLDVTASMGYLSQKIATEGLHELMMKLYSTQTIEDPALMFAAYGDYKDKNPLQITQFESDIRIAEQLMDLWLENGGQGDVTPQLLWHFAADYTRLDSIEKHNKKGFLFTIGDNAEIRTSNLYGLDSRVFGKSMPASTETILSKARDKFEIFHIMIGSQRPFMFPKLLPGRCLSIDKNDVDYLPEIILSLMQYTNGIAENTILNQWDQTAALTVGKVLRQAIVPKKKKGFFF